jgi:hypothetical protein
VAAIPSCRIVSPTLKRSLSDLGRALARSCPARADLEWLENLDGSRAVAALRCARDGPSEIEPELVPGTDGLDPSICGFHALTPSGRLLPGWGEEGVEMSLPVPLWVPMGAFFQVNRHLARWLFDHVSELAGEPDPTWDLHAGVGFLAAAAHHGDGVADAPRQLTLVEPYRWAAQAAARNLPRAHVAAGRGAEAYLSRSSALPREALVIVDPPRAGLSSLVRHRIAGWHPRRLLMLACDPATWARDASFFLARGYSLQSVELVDLFPSTHHVEIIARLEAR